MDIPQAEIDRVQALGGYMQRQNADLRRQVAETKAENGHLREHLGHALGLYHLGQTMGYAGDDGKDLPESKKARETAYGFVCAITNEGWIAQDEWPIWARMYHLEFEGGEAADETD